MMSRRRKTSGLLDLPLLRNWNEKGVVEGKRDSIVTVAAR
jgi:hypothetical protein